jgi:hypothetical protein
MAFLAARLFNTGNLLIANTIQFDEVTYSNAKVANSACYSSLFDEVTQPANIPLRILTNGTMQTGNIAGANGIFDEVTGIS